MSIDILMPALSPTMEEGGLAKWLVKEGDTVSSGDIIAEIETDKATMEVEAVDEGTIGKILVPEGTQGVAVNSVIAVLLEEDEDETEVSIPASPSTPAPSTDTSSQAEEKDVKASALSVSASTDTSSQAEEKDVKASALSASASTDTSSQAEEKDVKASALSVSASADTSSQAEEKDVKASALSVSASADTSSQAEEKDVKASALSVSASAAVHAKDGSDATIKPENKPEPEWTGAMKSQTVREALRDAMAEEMRTTPEVFVMGEEVAEYQGAYKVTQGLFEEFGAERVIDTPITEYGFAGIGVGAAFAGMKPIVEFMTFNFSMQAIDHIINSAAKTRYMSGGQLSSPIVFRGPNGVAARVGAQHSQCYAAWYSHIPGLKVVSPYSAADAKGLLKAAIRDPDPVVFLENELLYGDRFDVPDTDDWIVPIGKAKVVHPGHNVTIVAHSMMVKKSLAAAELLAEQGIAAEVIDLRTIRPLDIDSVIQSVQKTNRLVIAEEGWGHHGIGAEIAAQVIEQAFDWLDSPIARVFQADVPLPYAANLEQLSLPQASDVVEAALKVCYKEG